MGQSRRAAGRIAAAVVVALLAGCAAPQQDRFESINRPIHEFNETLDKYLIRPVAVGYDRVAPGPVRSGVTNFFSNLGEPLVVVNQFLQGKPRDGFSDTGRFLVNSTLGVGGFFDVAAPMGLRKHEEDFGQTFGVWGAPEGDFLVVPLWGAVTVRSGIGDLLDGLLYPPRYLENVALRNSLMGLNLVNTRAELLDAEQLVQGDRYVFFRDTYLQRRDYLTNDGAVEDPFLEDF
jgi:phospholipid-binding lipoprotein MlaA